jgi:hypothetical protein
VGVFRGKKIGLGESRHGHANITFSGIRIQKEEFHKFMTMAVLS